MGCPESRTGRAGKSPQHTTIAFGFRNGRARGQRGIKILYSGVWALILGLDFTPSTLITVAHDNFGLFNFIGDPYHL